MFGKVSDVGARARIEIVDAQDVRSRLQKPLAEMRAKKTGAACYQYPLMWMHVGLCFRYRRCLVGRFMQCPACFYKLTISRPIGAFE